MVGENTDADCSEMVPKDRSAVASPWRTHVALVLGLALCLAAFWFELHRALVGNALSWAYVFEWPLLAIFVVYMWWKVLYPDRRLSRKRTTKNALAPEFDSMLAAWQEHQQDLQQSRENPAAQRETR